MSRISSLLLCLAVVALSCRSRSGDRAHHEQESRSAFQRAAPAPFAGADTIFRALARGEVEVVLGQLEVDERLMVASESSWDQSLLHRAVAMDLDVVVAALLARGAALERRDRNGRTALHEARSAAVAARLLAAGANASALDNRSNTPLRLAVERAEHDGGAQAEALLAAGVPLDLVSAICVGRFAWVHDELRRSEARRREARQDGRVLLEAARVGAVELVDELLAVGSPVDGRVFERGGLQGYSERPLTVAVRGRHVETAHRLLEAGAPARGDFGWFEGAGFQLWDYDDGDLLCRAIADGSVELVALLAAHGADVDEGPLAPRWSEATITVSGGPLEPERCLTPLARGAMMGASAIVDALVSAGADLERISNGATPLFHAALAGHDVVAKDLIARGATVDAWSAAALGLAETLDGLLARDPSLVQQRDPCTASTLLQLAIERDRRNLLDVLVARGARVDGLFTELAPGLTPTAAHAAVLLHLPPGSPLNTLPLMVAIQAEHFEFARLLVQRGAPLEAETLIAALQSRSPGANVWLRELCAEGQLVPSSPAEGRRWLGAAALAYCDDVVAGERLQLLLDSGCAEAADDPVARGVIPYWPPGSRAGRARVLRELGFEVDFVSAVRLGIDAEIPQCADIVNARCALPRDLDWVQDVCVPAACVAEVAVVVQLLQALEAPRPADYFCCASVAAERGRIDVVKALVELGAPLSQVGSRRTWSLLHAAAEGDHPLLIRWLLQQGAELEFVDHDGHTALHAAADELAIHALDVLLAAGANVNARDDHGATPLHDAASFGDGNADETTQALALETIERLLAAGADPGARTVRGATALELLRRVWANSSSQPPPAKLVEALDPRPRISDSRWSHAGVRTATVLPHARVAAFTAR